MDSTRRSQELRILSRSFTKKRVKYFISTHPLLFNYFKLPAFKSLYQVSKPGISSF